MTDLIQEMIDSGHKIETVDISGERVEVGTVEDIQSSLTLERLNFIQANW